MKEFRYSKGYKAIWAALHQLFICILITLAIVGMYYEGRYRGTSDILQNRSFIESNYLGHTIQEEIIEIMRHIDQRENFEVNGEYDPDKVVDIIDYIVRARISGTINSSVGYTIEQLLTWSKEGIEYTTLIVCKKSDGTYAYYQEEDYEQRLGAGEILVKDQTYMYEEDQYNYGEADSGDNVQGSGNGASEATVTEDKADDSVADTPDAEVIYYESSWSMEGIVEKYAPQLNTREVSSLMELADTDKNVNGNLQEYYQYLEEVVYMISDDLMSYKESVDSWDASNITFFFRREDSDEIYANNSRTVTPSMFEKTTEELRQSGEYLSIDTNSMDFTKSTGLEVEIREVYNDIQSYVRKGDYSLFVHLDTSFKIKDDLYKAKMQYERMQPWFTVLVVLAAVSLLGYIVSVVELALVTGKRRKDGKVHLNWFDQVYTEIAAIVSFGSIAVVLIPVYDGDIFYALYYDYEMLSVGLWAVVTGGCVFVAGLIGLGCYLSLVRRIKAKTLWSRSITGSLIHGMSSGIKNRKATTKMFVYYAAFIIFNIIALLSQTPFIFLAVLLDIWVGLLLMREAIERKKIAEGVSKIAEGNVNYKIDIAGMRGSHNISLGVDVNNIGAGLQGAVQESMKNERLKTDLITNVSHDIKTPLTSIINYADLLKREDIKDEKVRNYINILEQKAQRLKHLTEDLVEASKISSGNIKLEFEKINFIELVNQTEGEFKEKFDAKNLEVITNVVGASISIYADGRRIWRVLENLYNNVAKYAMENTRVYVDVRVERGMMEFSIKNISKFPLNIQADELTERFIRGDISRSTEGSGLGLSIAKNLTELQNGQFEIYLDGDLFKVIIRFPRIN